jgi:adenosylcobinamide-GDP ribazoletransferase
VSGLAAAVRYLTIVPFPGPVAGAGLEGLGRGAVWFPIIGLALGAALALLDQLTSRLFPPLLDALVLVTAWKLASGGLHLDGLADCLDGVVGRDPQHRLAIMRDSRIGAFGAVGLILLLLLEIAALAELPQAFRARTLLVAPVVARALPPLLGRLFGPARPDGQGAAFHAGLGRFAAPAALAIAVVVVAVTLGLLGVVAVGVACLVTMALGQFMARRLGGITGDVFGAAIETGEVAVLLVVSAWAHSQLV